MVSSLLQLTELSQMEIAISELQTSLSALEISQETFFDIKLAVTEAISNAFLHGAKELECPQVEVEWWINPDCIKLKIKDNGSGFDYNSIGTIDDSDILAEKGRGLFLIFNLLDKVWFNDKGNEIYCLKKWGKKDFMLVK